MTNEKFLEILRYIRLPRGTLLYDGTTYRFGKQDFPPRKFKEDLDAFEKMLVLSDGEYHVVGGVLFYGQYDIQVTTLPKYRGVGYMSAIHRNGILALECYPGQQVSIATQELRNMDDFMRRQHMLEMAGLRAKNLHDVYKRLAFFRQVDCSEAEFLGRFG